MMMLLGRLCVLVMVSLSLMACFPESRTAKHSTPKPAAPTSKKATPPVATSNNSKNSKHLVRRGDTLYSIAWRYKLDYKLLAGWNQIQAPYTIFPGQSLVLKGPAVLPPTVKNRVPATKSSPSSIPVQVPTVTVPSVSQQKPASQPVTKVEPRVAPVKPTKPDSQLALLADKEPDSWQWPLRGKILRRFSEGAEGKQGIDIAGRIGTPIKSAAAGRVVYSGSGLKGYGRLIIIKHGERFLSAYAHNDRLLVEEGQIVKSGQVIAELGDSGASTPMLHFELRDSGFPIDPQIYLPK